MVAKNYTINFVDPEKSTLTILANSIVGPSGDLTTRKTDIDLTGMGYSLWGELILENLTHMLENFSCAENIHTVLAVPSASTFTIQDDVTLAFPTAGTFDIWDSDNNDGSYIVASSSFGAGVTTVTISTVGSPTPTLIGGGNLGSAGELGAPNKALKFSPTHAIEGQLWYNQTRGQVNVYKLSGSPAVGIWNRVGGIAISASAPTSPSEGDLWWETTIYATSTDEYGRNLHIYIGGVWTRVVEDYLPRNGSKVMSGTLDLNSNLISNVADPLAAGDGMSRGYADTNYVNLDGTSNTMTGNIDMNSNIIDRVGDPIAGASGDGYAMSRLYGDTRYVNLDGTSNTMTGDINMNTNLINNLGNAGADGDAVSRLFGDGRYVLRAGDGLLGTMGINVAQPTSPVFLQQHHASAASPNYHKFTNASTGTTALDGFDIGIDQFQNAILLNREATNLDLYTSGTVRLSIAATGVADFKSNPTVNSNLVWHEGNDGSGSGLDADTVDGVHANSLLQSSFIHTNSHGSSSGVNLVSGSRYHVVGHGITANRGNDNTYLLATRLYRPSGLVHITAGADIWMNWPDGSAPITGSFAFTATENGFWRIRFDLNTFATWYTFVKLNHSA